MATTSAFPPITRDGCGKAWLSSDRLAAPAMSILAGPTALVHTWARCSAAKAVLPHTNLTLLTTPPLPRFTAILLCC